jgi:GT2 family glycosyltransferase
MTPEEARPSRRGTVPVDLSIIIVSWNCRDELAACLRSLRDLDHGVSVETIVVDNASADAACDMVRREFPGVALIANEVNRGFAAANNQGLAVAAGRNVLLLNPDTVVHAGALASLVRTLDEDETIGACGPQLLNADGTVQPSVREFPTFAAVLYQYTPLRMFGVGRLAYRAYKARDFDFHRPADVHSLMGAALCVPRRVLDRVGALDERFFVYFEEVDLCRRMHDAGLRRRFVPEATITHLAGVSAGGQAAASLFLCRSMFLYLKKHNPRAKSLPGLVLLWIGMCLRELSQLVGNSVAAAVLLAVGRRDRASRRWRRTRGAARFLFIDAWRVLPNI